MALSLTYGALNGYWGQAGLENLRLHCDSGVDSVTLGFVNAAPENQLSGYPGTNFGPHCWAGTYVGPNGLPSNLLSECQSMKQDIPYCKSKGVKIILSIGGEWNPVTSDYHVSTKAKGESFADFLYHSFGPYRSDWTGPRPFDISDTEHTSVDGFDFDIEANFANSPYIAMINKFRSLDSALLITGAPECPIDPVNFHMKEMIEHAAFDKLFIQFYNNPSCLVNANTLIPGYHFNYDDWETIISNSAKSQSAKLYIGLPAGSAAGNGYIEPEALKDLVCQYKDRKHFGGISLWDLSRGLTNVVNGKTYNQHALDALQYGCNPVPTTTSSTVVSTTTSNSTQLTTTTTSVQSTTTSLTTTTTSQATTSSILTTSSATTTSVEPTTTSTSTEPVTTTSEQDTTTSIQPTTSTSAATTISEQDTTTSAEPTTTTTSERETTTSAATTISEQDTTTSAEPTTSTSAATTSPELETTTSVEPTTSALAATTTSEQDTTTSVEPTTASASADPTASTSAATSIAEPDTTSSQKTTSSSLVIELTSSTASASSTTAVVISYPTITKPWSNSTVISTSSSSSTSTLTFDATSTSAGAVTSTSASSVKPTGSWNPTTSRPASAPTTVPMTTSTAYTTSVRTVTKCPPYVVDCPSTGYVTTTTIPLYTTVCPVSETSEAPKPTITEAPLPWTTSTVYSTKTYTITSCAPEVIDCPVGRVTTVTIPLYTTVCPVSEISEAPEPTTREAPLPWTTSTVYSTRVHTITSCAPEVTNCPVGRVTTETVPWYTTVCPVTATETPSGPGGVSPPESTSIIKSAETTPVTKTPGTPEAAYPTNVPGSSSLQTVIVRPTTVVLPQQPSGGSQPSGISGTGYPSVSGAPSISSATGVPGQTGSSSAGTPTSVPSSPVTAGASMLSASMVGIVVLAALQALAL